MTDSLDDVLDCSAPSLADRGSARDAALRQMATDARDTVRPRRTVRRRRTAVTAALVGAFVVGSGGVAVAAGLVDWPTGFENPDSSFAFTVPSGRACEVRLVVTEPSAEAAGGENRAQEEIDRWLNSVDLWTELDMPAAEQESARIMQEQRSDGMTIRIGTDGWLSDASLDGGDPDADDVYAFAVNRAVGAALRDHLTAVGIDENEWVFGADGGVKCAAE